MKNLSCKSILSFHSVSPQRFVWEQRGPNVVHSEPPDDPKDRLPVDKTKRETFAATEKGVRETATARVASGRDALKKIPSSKTAAKKAPPSTWDSLKKMVVNNPRVKFELASRETDRNERLLLEQIAQRGNFFSGNIEKGRTVEIQGHKVEVPGERNPRHEVVLAAARYQSLIYIFNKFPPKDKNGMVRELSVARAALESADTAATSADQSYPGWDALMPEFTTMNKNDVADLCRLQQAKLNNDTDYANQEDATLLDKRKIAAMQSRVRMYEEILQNVLKS